MKVDVFYIFLGVFLGIAYIYIFAPVPKIVIKYPTLESIEKDTYVDGNNMCYRYYAVPMYYNG